MQKWPRVRSLSATPSIARIMTKGDPLVALDWPTRIRLWRSMNGLMIEWGRWWWELTGPVS